jgi:hypothetical protein
MKQFAIQAVCDEKVLWEIMKLLEGSRCTNIMARPLANGAEPRATKPNGMTRIDAALNIIREHGKMIRASEVRDALKKQGYVGEQVGGMLHVLQERKLIRRIGSGKYLATRKGTG